MVEQLWHSCKITVFIHFMHLLMFDDLSDDKMFLCPQLAYNVFIICHNAPVQAPVLYKLTLVFTSVLLTHYLN